MLLSTFPSTVFIDKKVCRMSLFIFLAIALSCIQLGLGEGVGNNWQTLTVKFTPPQLRASDPYAFNKMPLTRDEAKSQGWKPVENDERYKGDRYIDKNGEPSALMIYDPDTGRLIGMQSQFLAKEVHPDWVEWFENRDKYENVDLFSMETRSGVKYYAITAYTVDPDKAKSSQCENGVGCDLYFLKKDSTLWEMPKKTSEMKLGPESWSAEKCFDNMGKHHWWNISENMDCKSFEPFFLLYIDGNLSGYGLNLISNVTSPRLEEYGRDNTMFFYTVPKCLAVALDQTGAIPTIHFFFNDDPKDFKCD